MSSSARDEHSERIESMKVNLFICFIVIACCCVGIFLYIDMAANYERKRVEALPVKYAIQEGRETINCSDHWLSVIPFYRTSFGYTVELPNTFPRRRALTVGERVSVVEKVHINGRRIEDLFAFDLTLDEVPVPKKLKLIGEIPRLTKTDSVLTFNATVFSSTTFAKSQEGGKEKMFNANYNYQFVCPELQTKVDYWKGILCKTMRGVMGFGFFGFFSFLAIKFYS